jgi:selenocysteine lyase/cysteine desulfurase
VNRIPSIEQLRLDTPGSGETLHFNNAGCALALACVVRAQVEFLERESRGGGYEVADQLGEAVLAPYRSLARVVNARPDEVGFCVSATDAWRRVLYALPFPPHPRIAVDESIYGGNLLALLDAQDRFGWTLCPITVDDSGTIDMDSLTRLLSTDISAVAVTHMPAQSGAVNPIAEIGRLGRDHGAITIVDACQSLGQVPIDFDASIDGLVFTGRKYLRAPRGTGGFVLRRDVLRRLRPLGPDIRSADVTPDGSMRVRKDATALEYWEKSWALHVGLGAALAYLEALDPEWIWRRIQYVAGALVDRLREVPGVVVQRRSGERGGIVVFDVPGADLVAVRDWLRSRSTNIMFAGPQNAPLEMFRAGQRGFLRASVHYFNTEDEIEEFARRLATCIARL